MWLVVNDEMWNLDKVDGIVAEDNRVILVYPNHCEVFESKSGLAAQSVLCDIEFAIKDGQKVFRGLPDRLKARDEEIIYHRFG